MCHVTTLYISTDGSIFIIRSVLLECLLGALRVFLNITHDHELGSYRIGEQPDIVETILAYIFKVQSYMLYYT